MAVFFNDFFNYLPQLLINLEIEISLCNKKSYSQFPDLYEPVQAANVNTANNAKINFFIVSPFGVLFTHAYYENILITLQVFYLYFFNISSDFIYSGESFFDLLCASLAYLRAFTLSPFML